jgi:hypothetical protein
MRSIPSTPPAPAGVAGLQRPANSVTYHVYIITDLRRFFDDFTARGSAGRLPGYCCTAATSHDLRHPEPCHRTLTPP